MFLLILIFSLVPLGLGAAINILFGNTRLSRSLFLLLVGISIWQMDVSILFANGVVPNNDIFFLFRLFRIGSIIMPFAMLYVSYVIYDDLIQRSVPSGRWRPAFIKLLWVFGIWSAFVYAIGWSDKSISSFFLVQPQNSARFFFPVYGSLSWIFKLNILFFFVSILLSWLSSRKVTNVPTRTFLQLFIVTCFCAYSIGTFNMSPSSGLYASNIAVLLFAICSFAAFCIMHSRVVKEMSLAVTEQKDFLTTVINANPNFIYAKNSDGNLTLANSSFAKLVGEPTDTILGKNASKLVKRISNSDTPEEMLQAEEQIVDSEGSIRWLQTVQIPIEISHSKQLLYVSTDITERKQYEDRIIDLAFHDTLTGLPNRLSFNTALNLTLSAAYEKPVVLMFIDLDRFKTINDTLGHSIGDQFLKKVSDRLARQIGGTGTVYRIGGDEFVIMIENCSEDEAAAQAELLLKNFKLPFYVQEHEVYTTPSIGISISPFDGMEVETLMKHADIAMHHAKEQGKNNFRFYNSELESGNVRKMILEKELHKALQNEEFIIHYQPQISLTTGKLVGLEALIRWDHPTLGMIPPMEFIPLAEETGLIVSIGEWVLRQSCRHLSMWREAGADPVRVAVNISSRQFREAQLLKTVESILKETRMEPELLELEITESVAMFDAAVVIEKLLELKELGISISMDDFGTGYSSLSYLKKLPIDKLKIDKSFLTDVKVDPNNAAIVATIISMAQNLHLQVIAEGVEDQDQVDYLKQHQCNEAQGFYFYKPMPCAEIQRLLVNKPSGMVGGA